MKESKKVTTRVKNKMWGKYLLAKKQGYKGNFESFLKINFKD